MIQLVGKRISPLCYLKSGILVCYQYGRLLLINNGKMESTCVIFKNVKEFILARSRLLSRLLRIGVRSAIALNEDTIILSVGRYLYEYSFSRSKLSRGFQLKKMRPLMFAEIFNVKGFEDGIYFGGYVTDNKEKEPVGIYKRIGIDMWEIVYMFKSGEINHIHSIIPDSYRNCVWIMTGDFDDSAAIWKATDNFSKVERFVAGNQKYRGCVGFSVKDGLLYATDTPYEQNYIYLLEDDKSLNPIVEIDGSCIYGCQCGTQYVFSTTVEADGRGETILKLLFSRKIGEGIKNSYVHVYSGNIMNSFQEIYKTQKDLLPFIFQFGTCKFPAGKNYSDFVYFMPIATNDDQKLFKFRI